MVNHAVVMVVIVVVHLRHCMLVIVVVVIALFELVELVLGIDQDGYCLWQDDHNGCTDDHSTSIYRNEVHDFLGSTDQRWGIATCEGASQKHQAYYKYR